MEIRHQKRVRSIGRGQAEARPQCRALTALRLIVQLQQHGASLGRALRGAVGTVMRHHKNPRVILPWRLWLVGRHATGGQQRLHGVSNLQLFIVSGHHHGQPDGPQRRTPAPFTAQIADQCNGNIAKQRRNQHHCHHRQQSNCPVQNHACLRLSKPRPVAPPNVM